MILDPDCLDPYDLRSAVQSRSLKVLRQSTVSSAEDCAKKGLEYGMDPTLPRSDSEATIFGTAYHLALERYYRERMLGVPTHKPSHYIDIAKESYVPARQKLELLGRVFEDDFTLEEALDQYDVLLTDYFAEGRVWPEEYRVIGVEQQMCMPFRPGWAVVGTMDLLLMSPEGWIVIADHKTAKRKWTKDKHDPWHNIQASWYIHWVKELQKLDMMESSIGVTACFDVVTRAKGEFERRPAERTQENIDAVLLKAEWACRLYEVTGGKDLPGNTSSYLCNNKFCSYFAEICPLGARQGRDRSKELEMPGQTSLLDPPELTSA